MPANETETVGSQLAAGKGGGTATTPDTIKGWNNRRKANNQVISSMVPFVQLIGTFDEKEYNKMFKMAAADRVEVTYDGAAGRTGTNAYNETFSPDKSLSFENIEKQLKDRFINLYIIKNADHGLNVAPINGIMMAEKVSQMHDPSGGIGISDLQVDYGKSSVLGSRKFVVRMTINDPKILDERFEYSKMATMGAQFIIIYGWANPESVPGYDAAMSPPKLEIDPRQRQRQRMIIPLRNLGNGGYWSAARVSVSKYDFSFNEMGKLEIAIVFRDEATLGMTSTTLSAIAKKLKLFLADGTLDRLITSADGREFTLREALAAHQRELVREYREKEMSGDFSHGQLVDEHAELVSNWDQIPASLTEIVDAKGELLNLSVGEAAPEGDARSYPTQDDVNKIVAETRTPQKGYPEQNALYVYKQIYETVLNTDPASVDDDAGTTTYVETDTLPPDDDDEALTDSPTKQIISYTKKAGYFFLGAIMDSVSLCMADAKLGIGSPMVPSFFYRDISPDSKLSTAFQSKIESVNRATGMEERIQEAIIRLKERFLPPTPRGAMNPGLGGAAGDALIAAGRRSGYFSVDEEGQVVEKTGTINTLGQNIEGALITSPELLLRPEKHKSVVAGTQIVYEGEQTAEKTRVMMALFPAPPKMGRMVGAPMRGHLTIIQTNDPAYAQILSEKGLQALDDPLWCFIPDWKQEIAFDPEGNELISSGSPDGFDPLNPSEYRAADQNADPDFYGTSQAREADEATQAALDTIAERDREAGVSEEDIAAATTFERSYVRPTGEGGFPVVPERSQEPYGRGGKFFMVMTIGGNFKLILNYDTWRLTNSETWNLLQKKWHNLYREYLSDYFERIIRSRVRETEEAGMPIETIYNEVLDLDWLTGIIYDNNYWERPDNSGKVPGWWLKSFADVQFGKGGAFDLDSAEVDLNEKIAMYNDIIEENTATIEGKGETVGYNPNVTQYKDYEGGASVVAYHGLRGVSTKLVDKINKIKIELERLTGGRYERDDNGNIDTKDVLGNTIMLRFKNFNRIVASETEFTNSGVQYEMAQELEETDDLFKKGGQALAHRRANPIMLSYTIAVYEPEIEYEYRTSPPEIKEQWILWNDYQVPTDNFQNQFNVLTRDWEESDRANKAQRWKQENAYAYQSSVLPRLETQKRIVRDKLNTIRQYQEELSEVYDEYQQSQAAINNATTKIDEAQKRFESYSEFFREDTDIVELSPYDDTSDFDGDGIRLPHGREHLMHLTTKVAQQWARRFEGVTIRGAIDVRNYGPPRGGKEYLIPTNRYKFKFDGERRNWAPMGVPKRVLDPEVFQKLEGNSQTVQGLANRMLQDLSFRVEPTVAATGVLSKNMPYEAIHDGRITEKGYQNWSLFGSPGVPNDFGNNQWGFTYGPPIEKDLGDGNIEIVGGNYVRTYKDFLNLFGLAYNPDWPDRLRIVSRWPMPRDNPDGTGAGDADRLMENGTANIPIYTLIDEMGNVLVDDGDGWYLPSGWYLDFASRPIYLYPSRTTACKINTTSDHVDGVPPGGRLEIGHLPYTGHFDNENTPNYYDRQQTYGEAARDNRASWSDAFAPRMDGDKFSGRNKKFMQAVQDHLSNMVESFVGQFSALVAGDFKAFMKHRMALAQLTHPGAAMAGMILTHNAMKKLNDGTHVDYNGRKPAWGARIGKGEHCPNLTLDMKRSMIVYRPSTEDKTSYLGYDMANGGGYGPDRNVIDFPALEKIGKYYVLKSNNSIYADYSGYSIDSDGVSRPRDGASVIGPLKSGTSADWPPFGNIDYPYGTGYYNPQSKEHGPWVFPQKYKNWIDWGDLLQALPGYGFFTKVDNKNYTSCMVQPNGAITDGLEINEGFVKFLIQDVFAPLPKNRRCAARDNHKPIKIKGSHENDHVQGYHDEQNVNDVTYGDLFGPLNDKSEDDEPVSSALKPASFGNIDNFTIDNVKNVPIRAELINNLINKNNTNMSVTQFFGEILRPGAVGVNNAGNTQMAMRQGENGTFEVFCPSSINWGRLWDEHKYLLEKHSLSKEEEYRKRFPDDILLLDFRASDSLIENMDMASTFDPLVARAFKDAAVDFTGSTDALLNFMSYKDVAPDLLAYLEINAPELQPPEGSDRPRAIIINDQGEVTLNQSLLLNESGDGATVQGSVISHVTSFLQANPGRLNAMRALQQASQAGQPDAEGKLTQNNYATQLMANYMRKTTITIHGTTNISPFQVIIVKGIMPDLQGMYLITSTRESITPQGFQTILEGTLIQPPSSNARLNKAGESVIPEQEVQDEVAQVSAPEPPSSDVAEAGALETSIPNPPQPVEIAGTRVTDSTGEVLAF